MPYELNKRTDALNIEERQYSSGPEIKFTHFSSCIGVIAKKGAELTAVYLSICAEDGSIFGADAQNVRDVC